MPTVLHTDNFEGPSEPVWKIQPPLQPPLPRGSKLNAPDVKNLSLITGLTGGRTTMKSQKVVHVVLTDNHTFPAHLSSFSSEMLI